jgi:hypothetical protein
MSPHALSGGRPYRAIAVAVAAAVLLLAWVGAAAAQDPPAPPSGDVPLPPPGLPQPPTEPSVEPTAPPVSEPGHEPSRQALVELAVSKATLKGNRLTVPTRCSASGRVALRRAGRMIDRKSFTCLNDRAIVAFTVPSREVRALRRAGKSRLMVRFRAAGTTLILPLTVTANGHRAPEARAAQAGVYCSDWAWSDYWQVWWFRCVSNPGDWLYRYTSYYVYSLYSTDPCRCLYWYGYYG